jgi:ectoine hydroxylase
VTTTTHALSPEQRATYERDGFVVLPALFTADELQAARDEADRLADELVNASIALGKVSPRLDLRKDDKGTVLLKIQPVGDISPVFAAMERDPRLLDPMRELLGCEPLLLEEKLNGKERLAVGLDELGLRNWAPEFPWHTDMHYFYFEGYPDETLSSAIALDDCTEENGPLRFVPGSHLKHDWPVRTEWPPDLADGAIDDSLGVPLICPAGTVVVFHSRVVHASSPNRTAKPRRLIIYSHFPETHQVEPDARNKGLRAAGREHESEYADLLATGGYVPTQVRLTS